MLDLQHILMDANWLKCNFRGVVKTGYNTGGIFYDTFRITNGALLLIWSTVKAKQTTNTRIMPKKSILKWGSNIMVYIHASLEENKCTNMKIQWYQFRYCVQKLAENKWGMNAILSTNMWLNSILWYEVSWCKDLSHYIKINKPLIQKKLQVSSCYDRLFSSNFSRTKHLQICA